MVGRALAPRLRRRTMGWVASAGALARVRPALPQGAGTPLTRYLLPAAALLAVTAAVLIVRSELRTHEPVSPARPAITIETRQRATRPHRVLPSRRYYVVRSGDTLDAIAARTGTSVASLLRLNPGIQPTTLRPGQSIRVK